MKLLTINLLMILFLLSGCTSAGLFAWNSSLKLTKSHQVHSDIAYGDKQWQKLDIYQPAKDKQNNGRALVFFYGGSWDSGNKEMYYFIADVFVSLGYTVIIPDYVKYPDAHFPEFMYDGAAALAWTKRNIKNYSIDQDSIVVAGHSAGAHMGALLLANQQYLAKHQLKPTDFLGFVGLAGPYRFNPKKPRLVEIFGPEKNFPNMHVTTFVDGDEPPMLLLHSKADTTVFTSNQTALIEALHSTGDQESKAILYDDLSHVKIMLSLTKRFGKNHSTLKDTLNFIDQLFAARATNNK